MYTSKKFSLMRLEEKSVFGPAITHSYSKDRNKRLSYWNNNSEAAARRFLKKVFIKISQKSQENICVAVFFNKVAGGNFRNL